MRQFAEKFYKSQAWKMLRDSYMAEVGGLCEECEARGLYTPAVEVHHIIHLSPENIGDVDITLNRENLIALCKKCHKDQHKKEKRYRIDGNGDVIVLR